MTSTNEDFYDSLLEKNQKNATLRWLLTVVNGTVFCGWMIGASGLSVAWLVLLIVVTAVIWSSSLIHLIENIKNEEIMKVRRRTALSKDETAEWLNILFNRWVFSSKSIFQLLRERFEPLLNDVKPSFVEKVELRQFTFGEQTPCLKSIRTYDVVDGKRIPYGGQTPNISRAVVKYQVAVEVDLYLNSEEFRLLLRTRLFGKGFHTFCTHHFSSVIRNVIRVPPTMAAAFKLAKRLESSNFYAEYNRGKEISVKVGVDLDIAMEKLNVCGKLELLLTIDMDSPFPHVTDITVMFIEKPQVWFSIKMLKAVQMMEVPVLKTWIHSVFMDTLETALVDPGKIHINLSGNQITPGVNKGVSVAQGVLTVIVSVSQYHSSGGDSKWIALKIGNQYFKSSPISQNWNETPSFLVESLQTDKLVIKLKSKRLVNTVTLAQYEMFLSEYNLENTHNVETLLQKKSTKGSNIPNITVRLEYAPLPDTSSEQPGFRHLDHSVVSGVVTVFIHSAQGLIFSDPSHCNSYCMLFSNRRKVLTTHCVYDSTSPQWQSRCQILVNDYTQTSFSFVVCSTWNPKKMNNDEMLGVAVFNFTEGETRVENQQLPLSGSTYCIPSITVSIIFQPINITNGTLNRPSSSPGSDVDSKSDASSGKSRKPYSSLVQQAKHLLGRGDQDVQSGVSISQILSSGTGLMEISLIQARDLIPMDKNGLSDPYCEFKVNGECKYKSSLKKKTLHPVWEENAIMGLPRPEETFDVLVWDRDIFGKNDFLGSVVFTLDEVRQMSSLDSPKWFTLQGVRSGAIELKIRIISEDNMTIESNLSKRARRKMSIETSGVRRPSVERSHIRLGVQVPPPTPPRTVSIPQNKNTGHTLVQEVNKNLSNGSTNFICDNSDNSSQSSFQSLSNNFPRITITEENSSATRTSSRASSQPSNDISVGEPPIKKPTDSARSTNVEFSAFRSMREKVSKSLRLRKFKSEVNVRQESKSARQAKERDEIDFLQRESLSHAISQPNIRNGSSSGVRPTELNVCPAARPDKYSGVEGKVLQAQGLHVAHIAQLFCRIKLLSVQGNEKNGKSGQNVSGKTLAKSHLLPAVPNPQFDLHFQISSPENVPRQAVLLFEIRSSGKEIVAVRRVTLQDLLSAEGKETHTWLALSNGATLEVTIAHGKELKKHSKKLFRSWSVHRIGKI